MMGTKYSPAIALAMMGFSQPVLAAAAKYAVVHSFQANGNRKDGANPSGLMAYAKGMLYGTTQGGSEYGAGTVFALDPKTGTETVLYTFKGTTDGYAPSRDLVFDQGTLYGTTAFGGQGPSGDFNETGTLFAVDIKTGHKRTLFEFPNDGSLGYAPGDVTLVNGVLYGLTAGQGDPHGATYYGTLFSFDLATHVFTDLHDFTPGATGDGGFPLAGLLNVNGVLYGTTKQGGSDAGSVFSYTISTNTLAILVSLGVTHGYPTLPESTPVYLDGALYMTSSAGGLAKSDYYGYGTVFKVDLATNAVTVLHSFQNKHDGQQPFGGLIYSNGLLYGATAYAGSVGGGELFSVDPATGAEKNLHGFGAPSDGNEPVAAMTAVGNRIFGTTAGGGSHNKGAVYSFIAKK